MSKFNLTLQQQVEITHIGKLWQTGRIPFYEYHSRLYPYYSE